MYKFSNMHCTKTIIMLSYPFPISFYPSLIPFLPTTWHIFSSFPIYTLKILSFAANTLLNLDSGKKLKLQFCEFYCLIKYFTWKIKFLIHFYSKSIKISKKTFQKIYSNVIKQSSYKNRIISLSSFYLNLIENWVFFKSVGIFKDL